MKKFSREFNGYNRNEVNKLLNEVIEHTESVLAKMEQQKQEIQSLNEKIIHYQNIENGLRLALEHAEDVGSSIRQVAKTEAKEIVDEARRNADRIVNDALIRAEKLELKNNNVERNLRIFKKKLRAIVEQQLDIVEEIEILEVEDNI